MGTETAPSVRPVIATIATPYAGADWLRTNLRAARPTEIRKRIQRAFNARQVEEDPGFLSPFGALIADLVGHVYRGLYHYDQAALNAVDWSDPDCIPLRLGAAHSLGSFDYNELSQFVVLCHDACVRFSVQPCMRSLRLCFHQRARTGSYSTRHPTLEGHARLIREHARISTTESLPLLPTDMPEVTSLSAAATD